ncbi:unnamed protein product [Amoebophrya sp. A120]|nr:unnamed protein product [Amoebophrya sp. A120]|eukprot:GSA120T00005689001.1
MQPSWSEYLYATGALAPGDEAVERIKQHYLSASAGPEPPGQPDPESPRSRRADDNLQNASDASFVTNYFPYDADKITPTAAPFRGGGSLQFGGAVSSTSAFVRSSRAASDLDPRSSRLLSRSLYYGENSAAVGAASSSHPPHHPLSKSTSEQEQQNNLHPVLDKTRNFLQHQEELRASRDLFFEKEIGRLESVAEAEKAKVEALERDLEELRTAKEKAEKLLQQKEAETKGHVHSKYLVWQQQQQDAGVSERRLTMVEKEKQDLIHEVNKLRDERLRVNEEVTLLKTRGIEHERRLQETKANYDSQLQKKQQDLDSLQARLQRELGRAREEHSLAESKIAREADIKQRDGQQKIDSLEERVGYLQHEMQKAAEGHAVDARRVRDVVEEERKLTASQRKEHEDHVKALQKAHTLELEELKQQQRKHATELEEQMAQSKIDYDKDTAQTKDKLHVCETELEAVKGKLSERENELASTSESLASVRNELEDFRGSKRRLEAVKQEFEEKKKELQRVRGLLKEQQEQQLEQKRKYLEEVDALREFANKHARSLRNDADRYKVQVDQEQKDRAEEREAMGRSHEVHLRKIREKHEKRIAEMEQEHLAQLTTAGQRYDRLAQEKEAEYEMRIQQTLERHKEALDALEERVRVANTHADQRAGVELQKKTVEFEAERHRLERKLVEAQQREAEHVELMEKNRQTFEKRVREEAESARKREEALQKAREKLSDENDALREEKQKLAMLTAAHTRLEQDKHELLSKLEAKDAAIVQLEEKVQTAMNVYESKLRSANQQKDFECNSIQSSLRAEFEAKTRDLEEQLARGREERAELEAALEVLARQHHDLVAEKRKLQQYAEQLRRKFGEEAAEVHRDLGNLRAEFLTLAGGSSSSD